MAVTLDEIIFNQPYRTHVTHYELITNAKSIDVNGEMKGATRQRIVKFEVERFLN